MHRWNQRLLSRIIPVAVLVLSAMAPFLPTNTSAAGFQQAYVRLERMRTSTDTGGLVCARPATTATEAEVIITFPSTYTLDETEANWIVTNTNLPAGTTFWLGMTSGSTVATLADNSAKTVSFVSGNLTVGTTYCFNFASVDTLTTASSAADSQQASIETEDSGNATVDFTQIALANYTDDRITVTAVVPPSFIFTMSGFADSFVTNLTPTVGAGGIVSTTGVTVTVTTNAKGGWIAWARDSEQGLDSATAGYTIATTGTVDGSPSTINGGAEGYVMDVDLTTDAAGGCTLAIAGEYNGATTAQGGTLSADYQPIATCTGTSPATANGDVITLIERATISGATPASSDYQDIITVVGAGNF
jgi:hypothetical protein